MEFLKYFIDLFLHLDKHLDLFVSNYGALTYLILFLIIFAETGLVVTPFLPGDSLLFAIGAIGARHEIDLKLPLVTVLLIAAAVVGDAVNYWVGYKMGPAVFKREDSKLLNKKHLLKA